MDEMRPYRMMPSEGGHAVILTGCNGRSLTFLNSWGQDWGKNGSFSVENRSVLDIDRPQGSALQFYDVFWEEEDLTQGELEAYQEKANSRVQDRANQFPSILEMEYKCPQCREISAIADLEGGIRRVTCPKCQSKFAPEPGHVAQALYMRSGLDVVE
jgi:DNA-directed RNA polymerase subunit RPC12/RpoP